VERVPVAYHRPVTTQVSKWEPDIFIANPEQKSKYWSFAICGFLWFLEQILAKEKKLITLFSIAIFLLVLFNSQIMPCPSKKSAKAKIQCTQGNSSFTIIVEDAGSPDKGMKTWKRNGKNKI
jgi:hypothetical protein